MAKILRVYFCSDKMRLMCWRKLDRTNSGHQQTYFYMEKQQLQTSKQTNKQTNKPKYCWRDMHHEDIFISQFVYTMQAIVIPDHVLTQFNRPLLRFLWLDR